MRIRAFGQKNALGGGVHFAEFTETFQRFLGESVSFESIDRLSRAEMLHSLESSAADDINIWFWPKDENLDFKGTNIVWAIFESNKLPEPYIRSLMRHDVVWVPTFWGRDILEKNGIDSRIIDVVPEGVNSRKFHPHFRGGVESEPARFRFLALGKFESRKGYDELLDAFLHVFPNDTRVRLVIKGDYFIDHERKRNELQDAVSRRGLTNVDLLFGVWSETAMLALYSSVDAFVFPSRAEGWGLPLIEALASGLPTVSTDYSGHSHYLASVRNNYYAVSHELVRIEDRDYLKYWPGLEGLSAEWAKADVESISAGLLDMVNRRREWLQKATSASQIIRQRYSWEAAVDQAFASLFSRNIMRLRLGLDLS